MSSKKILIIDDDPDFVTAMQIPLESNSYSVVSADSGKKGLQMTKKENPDLIILDIMMEKDTAGFHVAYTLRSDDPSSEYREYKDIPIIVITSIHQVKQFTFSLDTDAEFLPVDEFLEKPLNPDELLEKVKRLIG